MTQFLDLCDDLFFALVVPRGDDHGEGVWRAEGGFDLFLGKLDLVFADRLDAVLIVNVIGALRAEEGAEEQQHRAEVIELVIPGQRVGQVAADGLEDLHGSGIVLLHELLHAVAHLPDGIGVNGLP